MKRLILCWILGFVGILGFGQVDLDTQRSDEEIRDVVGGMVSGNTETLITVDYVGGKLNLVVNSDLSLFNNGTSGFLTSFTETNDLSANVTWADVPNANITLGSVTQHTSSLYEPIFSKNTAFNKDFGTIAGSVLEGDNKSLIDANTTKVGESTTVSDAINGFDFVLSTYDLSLSVDFLELATQVADLSDLFMYQDLTDNGIHSMTFTQLQSLVDTDTQLSEAEVKTAYENNANTNAYTDAEQTKVGHISVTQAVDLDQMEVDVGVNNTKVASDDDLSDNDTDDLPEGATNKYYPSADQSKVAGMESGATADQNASEVPFTPNGDIAATDAQAAIQEVRDDTDTKLAGKASSSHNHAASEITSGTLDDGRVAETNVTQHEAALSIAETQLTGVQKEIQIPLHAYTVDIADNDMFLSVIGNEYDGVTCTHVTFIGYSILGSFDLEIFHNTHPDGTPDATLTVDANTEINAAITNLSLSEDEFLSFKITNETGDNTGATGLVFKCNK